MVSGLIRHELKWLAPAPLWKKGSPAHTATWNGSPGQPAILRFDNDLFMEEMLSLLAYNPEGLLERIAKPETWEKPIRSSTTPSKAEVVAPISEFSKKQWQQRNKGSLAGAGLDRTDNKTASLTDGKAGDDLAPRLTLANGLDFVGGPCSIRSAIVGRIEDDHVPPARGKPGHCFGPVRG